VAVVGRASVVTVVTTLLSLTLGAGAVAQTTDPVPDTPSSSVPESPGPTTPTLPDPSGSTTTTAPRTTTTTTNAASEPTTTTAPAAPQAPSDSVMEPSPAETAAARAAFVVLSDEQRQLLRRLQATRDELATTRVELLVLTARVEAADARLKAAEATARTAERDAAEATLTLRELRSHLRSIARSVYQQIDRAVAYEAVNTADMTELNRARIYARAPQELLEDLVAEADATRQQRDDASRRAAEARTDAAAARDVVQAGLAKQRDTLAAAEHASTQAADTASAALGSGVALLAQVADPRFGADGITAALAVTQADDSDPATLVGAFRLPLRGAPVSSPYGVRVDPLTGSLGYHPGIDFEAPAGAEVRVPAAGTVVVAGDCGGYGNCVVIDHGHALATVYAHLQRVLVGVGMPVVDDQVLGLVGSTGRSTGPHLHLEVRLHGVPIDPVVTLTS